MIYDYISKKIGNAKVGDFIEDIKYKEHYSECMCYNGCICNNGECQCEYDSEGYGGCICGKELLYIEKIDKSFYVTELHIKQRELNNIFHKYADWLLKKHKIYTLTKDGVTVTIKFFDYCGKCVNNFPNSINTCEGYGGIKVNYIDHFGQKREEKRGNIYGGCIKYDMNIGGYFCPYKNYRERRCFYGVDFETKMNKKNDIQIF